MGQSAKQHLGRILLDGRFVTQHDLDCALERQKNTSELLGQVLVRMGVLTAKDVKVPLMVQEHLGNIDNAVKISAGERQLLGALLVQSGHITSKQLDHVIIEQQRSGERLGEVFKRLGLLTDRQLNALLDFQLHQEVAHDSPLRLGELLVATGHITRARLEDALHRQRVSHKKLGEVLVEAGYLRPNRIKHGIRLQKMLVKSVLAAILSLAISSTGNAASVQLQWDPNTEADLAGYKVYYAADAAALTSSVPVDVLKETAPIISGLDPVNAYSFAVTAYNAAGQESSFSNIVTIAEQSPPSVAITSPADNSTVSDTISVNVSAADNVGVAKVECYVNSVLLGTDRSAPYSFSWDTSVAAPGVYTLTVKAYDAAGNFSQSSSSVTVAKDLISPNVVLTSPANNATVNGTVAINASASDNVGVTRVEFYCNSVLIYASNLSPYSFNWDTQSVANGGYTLVAKAYDNAGNITQSSSVAVTVNNYVPDLTAPTVSSFSLPVTATSLTVAVSSFAAGDNKGVTGYLITESAVAPAAGATGWTATAPTSYTFTSAGSRTAYAWARDAAGNVSGSKSATVVITLPDVTAPTVSTFTMPSAAASLTVAVSGLTATDAVGVSGYLITESATVPAATAAGWAATVPTSFTFSGAGVKTAYAWARDAAGNVSASKSDTVTITLPDVTAPTVTSFSLPSAAASLTVAVSGLTATDAVGVSGYLITESATVPAATAAGWTATVPTSFTFSSAGVKTAYAWARDAAGNVSASKSDTVTITLPDVTAPTVSTFTMPSAAASLTVAVSGLTATDAVGVSGYLITESATVPAATAAGWTATVPTSFTFSGAGVKAAYAWARDAAGNVSGSKSATVVITLPDVTAPTVSTFTMPSAAASLTVAVSGLTATDAVGVSGYLITESATVPAATAAGWTATVPTSFTFSGAGVKTAYAWARDAAGNVSGSKSATVVITLPTSTDLTIADALLALQIGSGNVTPTTDQMSRLDVAPVVQGISEPDGVVNTGDAIVLLSKVVAKSKS